MKIKWYDAQINKNDFKTNKFQIKRKKRIAKILNYVLDIFKKYYTNNIYITKIFLFFNFIFVKFDYMT